MAEIVLPSCDLHAVLVRLAEHEDQAHEEGQHEPAAQLEDVALLGREHAPLAGDSSTRPG